ncbi:hypothetical protein [Chryseobacterium sp. BIGb0232]|uniref:hypothetical protein n=1 Tax=Chryseobacterium sp. BIGb0232 TaxID=2940598 RepID=UPI000F47E660|nr:hypothetical protein [Chryseobacterium sp. BIGb0232]MCS4301693.1 hypothetical protein [Chryseobacterium sp. BIGb0232]ROS19453.1 hypothetical protein EDF65_0141 [Chryseobacterium nakagawai]
MGYNTFANPKGGYSGAATNAAPTYQTTPKPLSMVPPPKGKPGEFTEKNVYEGVGKFHGNHFRGYFSYISNPSRDQIIKMNKHLLENFCPIFSVSNVAKATTGKYKFNSKETIAFQMGGTIKVFPNLPQLDFLTAVIHTDWVAIEKASDSLSLFATTLKREWIEKQESDLFSNLTKIVSSLGIIDKAKAFEIVNNIIDVNQRHFLAGRRSWAIGFDHSVNLWYIETAAFERSSACEFNLLDKYGNLRQMIIDLWVNQINNYFNVLKNTTGIMAKIAGIPAKVNGKPVNEYADYHYSKNVLYKITEEKTATALLNTPWYSKCLGRHPGLTKGL